MASWSLENVYTVTGNTKMFSTEEFAPLNVGLQYHDHINLQNFQAHGY
jgi:hypothetical protein